MTYLDAAYAVLQAAKQPLHYSDITRRALEHELIVPTGLTPEATMGSRLYTDTQAEGSRFVRVGRGVFDLATPRRGGIEEQVQSINRQTRERLGHLLHSMPAKRFESLVMELLLAMGFDESTLEVTPYQGDGGIDVTGVYRAAGLTEVNVAVQAKRWKGNVQAPTVTSLRGSLQVHQQGIIITTSDFSSGARKEAIAPNKTHITLIDGEQLIDLLIKHRVGVVERSLTVNALDEEWWGELLNVETTASVEPSTVEAQRTEGIPDAGAPAQVAPAKSSTERKPEAITLFGERYPVRNWKGVLMTVCTVLSERHPAQFAEFGQTLHGRKRQYVSTTPETMFAPTPIPGTALYVETNMSSGNILQAHSQASEPVAKGEGGTAEPS
ncbi:MAG: restriction endonuclease, partial [Caldilinea sp.]